MKSRSLFPFLFFVFSYAGISLQAQDSVALRKIKSYSQHFSNFSKEYPQEKAYLHFDNAVYYMGETIWFKAYVVTAEHNTLSPLSKTLYVELITAEGNVVETKKMKIADGQCHGQFSLPDSLFPGFYEVRAYTRYSLNVDNDYMFSRVFPVYNRPYKTDDYSIPKMRERPRSQRVIQFRKEYEQKENLSLTFYPEGGNLVAGLNSKIAFKAKGKNGENVTVSGAIYDANGAKLTEIETSYQGMGAFDFTSDSGKYIARVQYNNKEYSFDLPNALIRGYAMNIDNMNEDNMNILIQKNEITKSEPLGLSISSRGKLYGFEYVAVDNGNTLMLSFPKKRLPSGVTQITLFNVEGQIVSERLAFINHHSQMKMDVVQNKGSYNAYEKVNFDFQLKDMKNKPLETSFSLAVRDAGTSTFNPYSDNMLTNLLLSSELKGYIENPGYYFEKDTPSRKAALDMLLLTQGWSRYVWKQMVGIMPFEVKHPIEESLVIEGKVLSWMKKKPKSNVDVIMTLISDATSQRGTCLTDQDGKFNLALQDFNGKSNLMLQTKEKGKLSENFIMLDRAFSPKMKVFDYLEKKKTGQLLVIEKRYCFT